MSLQETTEKIKPQGNRPYVSVLTLVIISILWALVRLLALESAHYPIKISDANASVVGVADRAQNTQTATVIGSKSGKKYYFPWCGTVKRIKPENQVPFASIELARQAGFTPGGNCKGLE